MNDVVTLVANLAHWPTNLGGRTRPILVGYRPLLRFENGDTLFPALLEVLEEVTGVEALSPGTSAIGTLAIFGADQLPPMAPGLKFHLLEGLNVVGTGEVVRVEGLS